jgi:two-component sensor histidine kinase
VRPHSEESAIHPGPSTIKTLLVQLLRPYPALDEGRLTIEGDDPPIDDRGATPIGLVFHELATNASKYGALSSPTGRVDLTVEDSDGRVRLSWVETGGPALAQPPALTGFGSRLTEISVVQQLGGTLEREWAGDGLQVRIDIPRASLHRP